SRYEIVDKIARGGMADVYRAHDLLLDRPVALKVLFPELSTSEAFVERFRREATAAANLSHPNIVSVYDWGREESTYFIVMELIDGETLSSLIRRRGQLEFDYAAAIAADVASALNYAHRHGVIHRDVKPGNVLIAEDGHVKVTDFGIARAQTSNEDLTQTGSVMGTATYISPEQAEGRQLDGRSDLYSLGVVLYEMIAGQPPFTGDSTVSVALKQVKEQAPRLSTLRADVPKPLEDIVAMAMRKDPEARYATAQDFRADLLRFIQRRPVEASREGAGVGGPATEAISGIALSGQATEAIPSAFSSATTTIPKVPADKQRKRDNRGTIIAILAAVLVLAAFFGIFALVKGNFFGTSKPTVATVALPNVVGSSLSQAGRSLTSAGLTYKVNYKQSSNVPQNTVMSQTPLAGTAVAKGSSVTLTVSSGPAPVTVPNVVDQTVGNAESQLVPLGFSVATTYVNSSKPNGTVIKQDPTAGTKAAPGSTVTLTVSNGPATVAVPNVVGQPLAQAANTLGTAGLQLGNVSYQSSDTVANGSVISTNPVSGTQVAPNTSVDVVVSSGSASTTTTSTTTTSTTTPTTSTT
ncbi:MAG: Stk1 family PASTA domain-containing Ser/Thr kinase, partial [Actinomycetota bacterium]|nr:Stk1 family PASTA domain-containing Ser/Thr kinase [Actinomycetota bacterium]